MKEHELAHQLLFACLGLVAAVVGLIIYRAWRMSYEASKLRHERRLQREHQDRLRRMKAWVMPRVMPIGLKGIDISAASLPHINHRPIHVTTRSPVVDSSP